MTKKTSPRKQALVEKLADHLLAQGLKGSSLRALAVAAGTSDRMLLHYFVDKAELMAATLDLIAKRFLDILERTRAEPMTYQDILPVLVGMMNDPGFRPYIRIWMELAASADGDGSPFQPVTQRTCDRFLDWISAALAVDREENRRPLAALALATLEGCVLLDALGAGPLVRLAMDGLAVRPGPESGPGKPRPPDPATNKTG